MALCCASARNSKQFGFLAHGFGFLLDGFGGFTLKRNSQQSGFLPVGFGFFLGVFGLDVDTPGRNGRTALGFACDAERRDFIGFIVSRGADPAPASEECEPYSDFIDRVENVVADSVAEGRFPRERLEMVFTLLRKDPWPLHTASEDEEDGDVIEILLALGYAIDAPSECCGVQPLHCAAKSGHTAVATAFACLHSRSSTLKHATSATPRRQASASASMNDTRRLRRRRNGGLGTTTRQRL